MNGKRILVALLTLLIVFVAAAHGEGKKEGRGWPPSKPVAKISPIQAMAIAQKKVKGGTPFLANFEFDEGHWVYGVMLVKGHKISEVEVDPISGKALDVEAVTAADEAKEIGELLRKVASTGG